MDDDELRAEMQRERETQERDWKIEPSRDYPNTFNLVFDLSANVSTSITAVNASEMAALEAQIGAFLEGLGPFRRSPEEWAEFTKRFDWQRS